MKTPQKWRQSAAQTNFHCRKSAIFTEQHERDFGTSNFEVPFTIFAAIRKRRNISQI
jgi:hypothetical protein